MSDDFYLILMNSFEFDRALTECRSLNESQLVEGIFLEALNGTATALKALVRQITAMCKLDKSWTPTC